MLDCAVARGWFAICRVDGVWGMVENVMLGIFRGDYWLLIYVTGLFLEEQAIGLTKICLLMKCHLGVLSSD